MTRRAKGTSKETEAEFTKWVRDIAHMAGFHRQYHTSDSRKAVRTKEGRTILIGDRDAKGWIDWIFINDDRGVIVFAELKADGKYPSPEQYECLDALKRCGLQAYWWAPRDRDEIEEVFLRWVRGPGKVLRPATSSNDQKEH